MFLMFMFPILKLQFPILKLKSRLVLLKKAFLTIRRCSLRLNFQSLSLGKGVELLKMLILTIGRPPLSFRIGNLKNSFKRKLMNISVLWFLPAVASVTSARDGYSIAFRYLTPARGSVFHSVDLFGSVSLPEQVYFTCSIYLFFSEESEEFGSGCPLTLIKQKNSSCIKPIGDFLRNIFRL